jgi:thymidylate synthase
MNVAFAIAEVISIVAGRRDIAFLEFWNSRYADYVGHTPQSHGAYGYRLRCQFNMDQLDRAYSALKGRSDSRQVVLQIWDAQLDMPMPDGREVSSDIPCNIVSILKVRSGRLEWMQVLRSNDVFLGLPHNLVQFTYLQEILAGWLEIEVGSYNQLSDSLHVYDKDAENVRRSIPLPLSCRNTDTISVPKQVSDVLFSELTVRCDCLIRGGQSEEELRRLADWCDAPVGYQNMLAILVAEAARRRSFSTLADEIVGRCQNPALVQLWRRWIERVLSK